MKTYARHRAHVEPTSDSDRPRKRIRMDVTGKIITEYLGTSEQIQELKDKAANDQSAPVKTTEIPSSSVTAPSSPSGADPALCSSDALQGDDDSELSSLPSSPPLLPSPKPKARRPAFSFLKRKRDVTDDGSASEPLCDITPNARRMNTPITKKPKTERSMTQMQIDLGGEVRKSCRTCGMEYIPSIKEDAALHSKYCAMNVGGVDMGKAFLKDNTVKSIRSERALGDENEMVVTVDRKTSLGARNRVKKVLEVVNAELSSADIKDEQLWGSLDPDIKVIETRKTGGERPDGRGDRFKSFLYMVNGKCVGFCLAEKIKWAFPVIGPTGGKKQEGQVIAMSKSSSISVSTTPGVALLGVSRIWVSKSHRGRGLAIDLLDCARTNFFYGVEAPKEYVAFSQPTESGGRLAERWFGTKTGWHVYSGDQ